MKHLVASALACLVVVGCGASTNESDLQGSRTQPAKKPIADFVTSIKGKISQVTHLTGQMGPAAPGFTKTFVTIEMPLGCFDKLAMFTSKVSIDSNKAEIHAAAYSLAKKSSIAAMCQPKSDKKTIELAGHFSENDIKVIWSEAPSAALKAGDTGVYAITKGTIFDLKEICPHIPGQMSCQATGSMATLNLALNGCVDTLGPVSHEVKILGNGKAELIVSAVGIKNEMSARARCAALPTVNTNFLVKEQVTKGNLTLDFMK